MEVSISTKSGHPCEITVGVKNKNEFKKYG